MREGEARSHVFDPAFLVAVKMTSSATNDLPPPRDGTPAAVAGGGENHAGLGEARISVETNGHLEGNLSSVDAPARTSLSPHAHETHGDNDNDGERVQQEPTTANTSSVLLPSRDSSGRATAAAATHRKREQPSTERSRRRIGKGAGRLAAQADGCSPEPFPLGREAGAYGGDGFGRLGVAGLATVVAIAMLSISIAQIGEEHHVPEEGGQDIPGGRGGGVGEGYQNVWRSARFWSGATVPLLLLSVSATVTAVLTVAAGCLWGAVRLARWREEIFAGSPVVAEVFSRTAALDDDGSGEERSSPSAESLGCAESSDRGDGGSSSSSSCRSPVKSNCGGNGVDDDPVGDIFRAGTPASHDFYAPCVDTHTAGAGGDRSRGTAASKTAPAAGDTTVEDTNGAVVFLTGVTGLVGQMVLFDLLKQGAAAGRLTSTDGDDTKEEAGKRFMLSTGLRRVVVLVRSKKGVCPSDRLASIGNSPMFRPLRENGAWADDGDASTTEGTEEPPKASLRSFSSPPTDASGLGLRRDRGRGAGAVVTAVEGELGKEGLGLTTEARALLAGAGVTHALHCAASVSFSDPLAEAAATNVTGALRVAALVASWPSCG